jgi:choloylglycine hydrolase
MCTAISLSANEHYFGRNLDLEYSNDECVVIAPQDYPFKFRQVDNIDSHYAIIGMATVMEDYPLYYDACNEKGLCMAGLNYPGAEY